MKKSVLLILILVVLAIILCSCGPDDAQVSLSNTITTPDGNFSFNTPDNWTTLSDEPLDFFVMSIWDDEISSANIFYYGSDDEYTAKNYVDEMEYYYQDNIIGETEKIDAEDIKGYQFEYSIVDLGTDGEEYNFHGYEYFFDMPSGVVEVDICVSQTILEGKLFEPSESQLNILQRIAESIQEN